MKSVTKLVVAVLPLLLIIGCGSKEVKEDDAASTGENVAIEGGVSVGDATGGTRLDDDREAESKTKTDADADADTQGEGGDSGAIADEQQDLLAERKIYFDFDRSEILGDYKDMLKAHANYLVSNPSASVIIEGNADERGTREYNMALGERRAYSVLQFLTMQGVSKSQLSTVSFGEERPDVEGHDESAWKWNRRAVLVYSE